MIVKYLLNDSLYVIFRIKKTFLITNLLIELRKKKTLNYLIFFIQISRRLLQGWRQADIPSIHTENHTNYNHTFTKLKSRTEYVIRISVTYRSQEKLYWPHDHRYRFKTAGELLSRVANVFFVNLRFVFHVMCIQEL